MKIDAVFRSRRSNVMSRRGMVATSQPLAAQAGLEMLRRGGSAADAAVATAAMLNVVEPMSTGIGGDCFALYYEASSGRVTALNGSGRSPAGASIESLTRAGYERMPLFTGHTVSVPGTVAGWSDLLARHGRMSLAEVLQPSIRTAEEGYPVSEWIAGSWQGTEKKLRRDPDWVSGDLENGPPQESGYEMLIEGKAPKPGEIMRIPTLAETLRFVASEGRRFIYEGEFARKLSDHVQRYGGWMTPADMAGHASTWEEPITADYRGVRLYECPPNGQGLAVVVALNLAAGFDLGSMQEVDRVHVMIECMRLGFAEAQQWVSDPALSAIPLDLLVSRAYAEERRRLIRMRSAALQVSSGAPLVRSDTVYLCAVDGEGNACSFINSLYLPMATGLVVPGTGVVLQNRASLFVLAPGHPNGLAPNKRPYHTIIPAMTVHREGAHAGSLHCAFGVMGGYMQPQGQFQVLVNMMDLGMEPQQALDMPRWCLAGPGAGLGASEAGGLVMVEESWDPNLLAELSRRGHRVKLVEGFSRPMFGGGQIIRRDPESGVLVGGSDPRKDGCAVGF